MQTQHNRNATALATLRIIVGIFFVLFGEYKVFGTEFTLHGGFEESIRGFLAQGAYPWMAPVLQHAVLPHARLCAFLIAYGELLIGLGLVFGVLTRAASLFGMLLMMLRWLSAGFPGPHVALWRYFGASLDWSVFAACFAAFLIGEPEARWSLAMWWRERQKPSSG
ncbi:MAG: thiosulfate dehydrogenase (quinone) large subunit [Acidobacteriaceae bacterium]|nr:thiosulfate dehydrogenase (quinone) large subunit [Acidobacteriaceae bacterium]